MHFDLVFGDDLGLVVLIDAAGHDLFELLADGLLVLLILCPGCKLSPTRVVGPRVVALRPEMLKGDLVPTLPHTPAGRVIDLISDIDIGGAVEGITAEVLDAADEAEEIQSVGMRCREWLIAMAKEVSDLEMVPNGETAPRRGDFSNWYELIANHIAHGDGASRVRAYLKSISQSRWLARLPWQQLEWKEGHPAIRLGHDGTAVTV